LDRERTLTDGEFIGEQQDGAELALSVQIQRKLERLILDGELKPGQKLNELELSKRFGTSRGPLREAMQNLCARGLAEAVRNRGVFVRTITPTEAFELYDVRATLFGLAGRLLTERIDDAILKNLQGFIEKMDDLADAKNYSDYYRTNLEFHDYLVWSAGNKILHREYHSFVDKLHLCRMRGLVNSKALSISNREHAEMINAAASGNAQRAQETFFRHVARAKIRFRSSLEAEGLI
jgi:DNA-binding GntR family transcriptional regulator